MVPFNIPAYLLSKVPLTHYVPATNFEDVKILNDNWKDIRDEALALYENGLIAVKDDHLYILMPEKERKIPFDNIRTISYNLNGSVKKVLTTYTVEIELYIALSADRI